MSSLYHYKGSELDLFSKAKNWKEYFRKFIDIYLRDEVLEVGAGIGGTTKLLCNSKCRRWVCLEPDPVVSEELEKLIYKKELPSCCVSVNGFISDLDKKDFFDLIIYIDVIEHIEKDREELILASSHLKPDGVLIILVPAHQWLYTPFDKEIGHFRRYNKSSLSIIIPEDLTQIRLIYLDSIGVFASLSNKLILNSSMPTLNQIMMWDSIIVPMSRIFDRIFQYRIGKSLLGIWSKKK